MKITNRKVRKGYKNEITDYLDEYLIGRCDYYSYIDDLSMKDSWLIRVPETTRGAIKVENDIIKEIIIHEDTGKCYKPSVFENLNKFVGMNIIFPE